MKNIESIVIYTPLVAYVGFEDEKGYRLRKK